VEADREFNGVRLIVNPRQNRVGQFLPGTSKVRPQLCPTLGPFLWVFGQRKTHRREPAGGAFKHNFRYLDFVVVEPEPLDPPVFEPLV
jgi:hypothetical protein